MVPHENRAQQLARAKGYPYPRPDTSFLFIAGDVFLFDNAQWRGLEHIHDIVGCCGSTSADFAAARGVDLAQLAVPQLFRPVLAIGSNAGPEQLRRKYPQAQFPACVVPVIQVELEDFDVVYTPYISSYGSCTATLEHSPGTTVSIFITYLTEPLMQRMHATEGGYNLCRLSGLRLRVAPLGDRGLQPGSGTAAAPGDGLSSSSLAPAVSAAVSAAAADGCSCWEVRDWAYQYNHKLGCLDLPVCGMGQEEERAQGATPVAIAEIPARGRSFPAATQEQVLAAVRAATARGRPDGQLAPVSLPGYLSCSCSDPAAARPDGEQLDRWILANINDPDVRGALCERLALHARPFSYARSEVIQTL